MGPSVHHRRFFAPVIAAREKHQPGSVEPDLFTVETQIDAELGASKACVDAFLTRAGIHLA